MTTNHPSRVERRPVVPTLILACALFGAAGCQTTGYHKGDAVARQSRAASLDVRAESGELETTITALNDLVYRPAEDLKPQFEHFSQALHRFEVHARRADSSVTRVWKTRDAYLQVWSQEIAAIGDEQIRQRSEARKAEVGHQFENASRQYATAKNSVDPLIEYLQDIRIALSADLTRDGLVAVQSWVVNASQSAGTAQTALAQSAAELENLGAGIATARPPDGPP